MSFGQFQFRRGTAAAWTSANPVLAAGELGLETDTSQFKIGDGTTVWTLLPYGGIVGPPASLAIVAPPLVNSGGASVLGTSSLAAHGDHTHGLTLASSAPPLVASDSTSVTGTATTPARSDHTHGLTMASVAPPLVNSGSSSVVGTASDPARHDHTHGLTLASSPPPDVGIAGGGVTGTATTPARSDHTHGLAVATTSVQGAMSATDKSRSDNWYNKAYYNVLDNGISPANSASANLTAMNALITAVTDEATIFFPPTTSTYDFSGVISIPSGKHLTFMGGGSQRSIIRTTSATADIFDVGDWYNEFHGLHFASSVTRTAGAAVNSGNNVAINFYNCSFASMFNGIVYTGGVNSGNLAVVDDCSFTNTVNYSIQLDGANANAMIRNCVADCSPASAAHVAVNQCGSLIIAQCDFIHATNNLLLNPDSGTKGVFSVYCANVFFDTAAGSSVKYGGGAAGTNVQRVKFVNCWFSGSVIGMEFPAVTSTNPPSGIDLVNCDVFSNSQFGILLTQVQDFSMNNCRVAGNTTAGIRTNAAAGSVTRFSLQNNIFGPASGLGANGIGVDIVAGTYGGYIVTSNAVQNNTSNLNIMDAGSVATPDLKQVINNTGHLIQGDITDNRGGVTSGTAETLLFNCRIPANAVIAGQTFRFTIWGQTSGAGTLIFRTRAGAAGTVAGDTQVLSLTNTTVAQAASAWQVYEGLVRVVTNGSSGTVVGSGKVQAQAVVLGQASVAEVVATINTTNVWFLDFSCACAAAGTFTVRNAVVEAL